MGKSLIKTSDGEVVTILDAHEDLQHTVRELLVALTGSEIKAMDVLSRLESSIIDTLEAAKIKPRERQKLFTFALHQFLVDPVDTGE